MQFLVTAYDGADDKALERRLAVREKHLEGWYKLVADGHGITGGAILDDEGRMIGSMALLEFPDRAAFDAWFENDPYVTGGVWQKIEVRPFRVAPKSKS
ncbi:YciI family protein [Oceanibaculum pacificum]|uniref:YCII-related domain-containing protein n=1 Tax=Oceanibaculum pacificum TaxID=580166 RepID=A0A154WG48_9PROT|nr:YciI family protein [Oceanibaculum pacificum]KZD12498.1 hypothetical protein AUP43_16210 [Oceanibaculum pacificum]